MLPQEKYENHESQYLSGIEGILDRPINPENIDTFAEVALCDIVDVVQQAVSDYQDRPTVEQESQRETEVAAFTYFGLTDIDLLLDDIADKASRINQLDKIVDDADKLLVSTIPADGGLHITKAGNGSFEKPGIVKRTKTTLFVLEHEFGVDIDDPKQFLITVGKADFNEFRQTPYHHIEVHIGDKHRLIFVCDETANRSYVFNMTVMDEGGYTTEQLQAMSKQELSHLVEEHPKIGIGFKYSNNFSGFMAAAIDSPARKEQEIRPVTLRPKLDHAHEGEVSLKSAGRQLGVSQGSAEVAYQELVDEGIIEKRQRLFGVSAPGRSLTEQEFGSLESRLKERNTLVPHPSEGELSVRGLSLVLRVSDVLVSKTLKTLKDEGAIAEEPVTKKYGPKSVPSLTPTVQNQIKERLEVKGHLTTPAQEGELSEYGLANLIGIAPQTLSKFVERLQERGNLGELPMRKFKAVVTGAFDIGAQKYIIDELFGGGVITSERRTELLQLLEATE